MDEGGVQKFFIRGFWNLGLEDFYLEDFDFCLGELVGVMLMINMGNKKEYF